MACELQPVAQAAQTALRAARTSLRPRLSICEINHEDKELPQQLLCAAGESSATYIGVQYQKGGGARALLKKFRQELLPHIEQPPCPIGQCELLSGPPARTTWRGRGALQRPAESDCDVLLLNMDDEHTKWRQALIVGVPSALRLAAAGAVIIVHGMPCKPPKEAGSFTTRHSRMATKEQCWIDWLKRYAEAGSISELSCASGSTRTICTGRAVKSEDSACALRPPLLATSSVTREPIQIDHSLGHSMRRKFRYWSALPCSIPSPPTMATAAATVSTRNSEWIHLSRATAARAEVRGSGVCLLFKDNTYATSVQMIRSRDGLDFRGASPVLVFPRIWRSNESRPCSAMRREAQLQVTRRRFPMSGPKRRQKVEQACAQEHDGDLTLLPNLAIMAANDGGFVAAGGLHRPMRVGANTHRPIVFKAEQGGRHTGIWLARSLGPELEFAPGASAALLDNSSMRLGRTAVSASSPNWGGVRWAMDGLQPGCIEKREMRWVTKGVCEFDGRLSLVWFKGAYLLYTRMNPSPRGSRFVHAARSTDGLAWGELQPLSIRNYSIPQGELYYFAVQRHPIARFAENTLLAVFPLVSRLRGCIGIAASRDGFAWSSVTPLLTCGVASDRTLHHPAAPALVTAVGDDSQVLLYVHENVPNVFLDAFTPSPLYDWLTVRQPAAHVVRYRIPSKLLVEWTQRALVELS